MKKIIFFLFIYINIHSQNSLQVEFSLLVNKSYLNIDELPPLEKDMSKIIIEAENLVTYTLISNNKESVYFNNEILYSDNHNAIFKAVIDGNKSNIFYDNENNKIIKKVDFMGKNYNIYENPKKWVITNETKIIQDFLCYKAIFEEIFEEKIYKKTAWFTSDIPYKIGPKTSFGLPGLVLEFQEGAFSIVAKSIKFKIDDNLKGKLEKPKGKLISQDEFDKIIKEARKDL